MVLFLIFVGVFFKKLNWKHIILFHKKLNQNIFLILLLQYWTHYDYMALNFVVFDPQNIFSLPVLS